jgi:hypothetical protein
MKKTASTRKRVLQLSLETVRTLRGGELSRVNAGCDTTSYTTDHTTSKHTDNASDRNCGQRG